MMNSFREDVCKFGLVERFRFIVGEAISLPLFCTRHSMRFNTTAVGEGLAPPAETMPNFIRCTASDAIRGFSVGTDVLGGPSKQCRISFGKRRS